VLKLFKNIKTTTNYYWLRFREFSVLKQVLAVIALLYLFQLFIPVGTLPIFAKLDGQSVGLKNKSVVASQYTNDAKEVDIAFGAKVVKVPAEQLGVSFETDKTIDGLSSLGWGEKLVPLYAYVALLLPTSSQTQYSVDTATLNIEAARLSEAYSQSAVNAKPKISSEPALTIEDAVPGYKFTEQDIAAATTRLQPYNNQPTAVRGKKVDAQVQTADYNDVRKQFNAAVKRDVTVSYEGKEISFAPQEFALWLEVVLNSNVPALQYSEQGFNALQSAAGREFSLATSPKETDKSRIILSDDFRKAVTRRLSTPSSEPVNVPTKAFASATVANTSLQGAIDSWIKTHGGGYQISVQEIGGAGRVAGYKSSQQTVLASTYKVFVAYAAYKQAEASLLSVETPVYDGQSIETCISKAILYSDNECAKAVAKYIGWAKIENMIAATGVKNIIMNNYNADGSFSGDKMGSALEIGKFLRQLQGGSLLNSTHTNRLLGYMKQQVYRSGIPAGSNGAVVADKVGFLDSYTHDAAIVYAPRTDYVLVIMSDRGANWGNIKSLSSVIYTYLSK
jgi:beta-lactamase class A